MATAQTGFEVATSENGAYGNSVTFTQSSGSASGTVWVRLKADAAVAGSYNNVTAVQLTSTGATQANISTAASGNSVSKATPGLSITSASSATVGGILTLTASSTAASGAVSASTGAITYSSSDTGVVSISSTTANAVAAGIATITANQAADANYNAATATQSFTVNAPAGSITPSTSSISALTTTPFGTPSGAASFTVSASGLTGNLSVTPPSGFEVSTSEGSGYATSLTLTPIGGNVGSTTVYVRLAATTVPGSYAGNINISGDGASTQLISVASSSVIKADQTITFGALASKTFGDAAFALGATAGSNLTVSYSSSNTNVATVSGNTVTIVGAGSTTITASQAGNSNYNAATSVDQTLTVNKASQTITFGVIPLKSSTDVAFSPGATATSGLSVSYTSSNPGVAIVSGNSVTIVGAGTTTITASQAGNDNYNAASPVSQSLTVRSTIAKWTFDALTGTTTATSTANFAADIGAGTGVGVHAASSTWNFVSGNGSTAALSGNTWAANDYFQFTVNASTYEDIFIQWDQARSSTGPTSFKLQYSTDGSSFTDVPGATALTINQTGGSFVYNFSDGTTGTSWTTTKYAMNAGFAFDLSAIPQIEKQNTLVFRIVSTVTPASGGTSRIDNVTISGVGVPTISRTGALSAVTSTYGIASSATSFSLSGVFLTTGVTVTPPPGFEVSTSADFSLNVGEFGNALVVGGAGTISATPVYVRLKATAVPGTYSGNIVLTSTGAGTVNVATVSSTMGHTSIDGTSLALNFPGATPANRVTEYTGWTSNNPEGSDGFTYLNGDTNNPIPYIGNWVSTTPNVELAYRFSRGVSEKIVFIWEQQITASVDIPGVDSFGWAFRDGSTTLFSFRFVPEQVIESDPNGIDWDENGVLAGPDKLVAVAFDGNSTPAAGVGMGPLDQVNFATFDRGQTVKFRVTIDLEAKSYSIDIDQAGIWFGLVFESALPAGTTNVDRMVALWDIQNTTLSAGNLYESGGDNVMLFDNFAASGSDLARTAVTLTLTAPTSPITYDGLAKAATATANPNVAVEINYWDTTSTASTTNAPVNAGTYTAKVTVVDEVTYAATPKYVTYTIAPKPVTVSNVSADNKEYDGNTSATLNTFGADIDGRVGVDDVNLAGTATGVFTSKNVATNIPVTVTGFTLAGTAAGNYTLTQPTPDADITAKEVTVTGAVASSKVYDRTDAATINLGSASLVGVISPDVVTVSGGGTFISSNAGPTIPVTANLSLGGANAGNYTLSQPTYLAADITARELTVPDAQAQDKSFDGTFTAVITGTLTGVLSGDTVTLVGEGQFADSNAGTNIPVASYLMLDGVSALNYSLTQPTGLTADINAQVIPVTLNPPSSFTYDSLPKEYLADSGGVMAEVSYQGKNTTTYGPSPFAPTNAGDYTVTATLSGNYSGSDTADFTIVPAALTVTADPQTKIYGNNDPAILGYTLGGSGLFGGDVPAGALVRDAGENVGDYAINQGTLDFGPNYTVTFVGDNLSITARELIISAEPKTKTYGDADPALTYTSFGLVEGDSITGSLTRVAGNDVGTYAINQGTVSAGSNYTIIYNSELLTINQRQLDISAVAKSKTYGDADPALTFTSTGLVEGDEITGSLDRVLGEDVGDYPIGQGTLAAGSNYWIFFTGANLTINAKQVTVTADTKSKTYLELDPELTYTVSPTLKTGDSLLGNLEREPGEDAGTYAILVGSLGNLNYSITFVGADFTINKADQTITGVAATMSKTFGDAPYSLFAVADSMLIPTFSSSNTGVATVDEFGQVTIVGAGTTTITVSQAGNNNYNAASSVTQALTVAKATPTIATAPTASAITSGQDLSASNLTGGSATGVTGANLAGSFAFTSPSTVPSLGTASQSVTFTPTDTTNYNNATTTVSVTVNSADGPWDVWADSFGLANGTARTHSADPDGDGFVNALEFAFGTSPVARNAQVFVSHTKVGSNYVVTFKKRKVASEVTYDIRQSTDLKQTFGSGTTMDQGSVTSVDANYEQTTVTLPISGSRGFVRMQATVNVQPSR